MPLRCYGEPKGGGRERGVEGGGGTQGVGWGMRGKRNIKSLSHLDLLIRGKKNEGIKKIQILL